MEPRFPYPPSIEPSEPARLVLIVEDDPSTLRFFSAGLKGLQAKGWRLLYAPNGAFAVEILSREPVDVLVTDLNMPVMDGYGLIGHVNAHYPNIPIIVITSLSAREAQDRAIRLGAMQVISKPVRMSLLMDEIRKAGKIQSDGMVRGLPLASLLQLLAWEEKSCTLKVRHDDAHGYLYIQQGRLVHAETDGCAGLPAAHRILRWERPLIEFSDTCRVTPTFNSPVAEILMDMAVLRDHESAGAPR